MKQYLDLLTLLLSPAANVRGDRTGTGTRSVFGHQMRFDLSQGFPLVTTKKVHLRAIIHELLWFLTGDTNIEYLTDSNVNIWDEWAEPEDITKEVVIPAHERAALLAEKLQIARTAAVQILDVADRALRDRAGLSTDATPEEIAAYHAQTPTLGGNGILLEHGIPTHRSVVTARKGDLGPVYGKQWRNWSEPGGTGVDQIKQVIADIKMDPYSRRLIVSAWNVADLPDMALQPCHVLFQFYVTDMSIEERINYAASRGLGSSEIEIREADTVSTLLDQQGVPDKKLSCQLYQRSADVFLGLPFNIASYALLTHMVAQVCDMAVGDFVWSGGDVHLYSNHVDQAQLQLSREPLPLPTLWLSPNIKNIDHFGFNDIKVLNYDSHPAIKAPIAV